MELRDYLHFNRMSITAFAEIVDVSSDYMRSINKGRLVPSRKLIKVIERATQGKVTAADLIPLIQPTEETEEDDPSKEKIG